MLKLIIKYLGGFLPKDSPNGGHYVTEKFQTSTEHAAIQPIVHQDEPVVGLPPIGSGNLLN